MKFIDPVAGIGYEKFPDPGGIVAVEINGFAPFVFVSIRKVCGGELRQIISVRAEMVVNDVEDDAKTELVRTIDEGAKLVRRSVEMRRREKVDSVVSPAEGTRKLSDRHDLQQSDSDIRQMRQKFLRRVPRAFPCKSTDVHFVKYLSLKADAGPIGLPVVFG